MPFVFPESSSEFDLQVVVEGIRDLNFSRLAQMDVVCQLGSTSGRSSVDFFSSFVAWIDLLLGLWIHAMTVEPPGFKRCFFVSVISIMLVIKKTTFC